MALKVLEDGSFQPAAAAQARYIIEQQVLNLVYELPEDGTNVSNHVSVGRDHTFRYASNLFIKLVL